MKKLWIRLGIGLLAAGIAVAATALLGDTASGGKRTDGLFYQATDIHPDAKIITVNAEPVTAEEYLYWLAYDCEYLSSYMGTIDWNETLTGDMTYGDYAKADGLEAVKMFAVIRAMARQNGVELTEEDQAALQAQKEEYIVYYGGEETYRQQIALMGVSEETFDRINAQYYLLDHLAELATTEGSRLYPSPDALAAYVESNGYVTARLLYLSTAELDEDAVAAQQALAEDYLRQLREQSDAAAAYDLLGQMAQGLGLEITEDDLTFGRADAEEALLNAILALEEGAVSDVVQTSNGFYISIRRPLNTAAVAEKYFNEQLTQARQNARVVTTRAYDNIDVGHFYTTLLALRRELADTFAAAS